jgi:hypothetical protein
MGDVLKRLIPLALVCSLVAACTSANPLGISVPALTYKEERTIRGVVNGLWKHDTEGNSRRLQGAFVDATEAEAGLLADQHQVRVGINRSYFVASFLEIVLLPKDWSYSLDEVVDDGHTINVGDVVDVQPRVGTKITTVTSIVRKCNAAPAPDENKDWAIGCKPVEEFDSRGYGGQKYYLSGF